MDPYPPRKDDHDLLVPRVLAALEQSDRASALILLRELVEGTADADVLPVALADALVKTAAGPNQESVRSGIRSAESRTDETRERLIEWLQSTPFGSVDLAIIRAVVASLETAALQAEEHARGEDLHDGVHGRARRVGSVWIELKYIPDSATGRQYGPYLYGRWRESGRKRSRYIGKAPGG